jgi:hypothetical protein
MAATEKGKNDVSEVEPIMPKFGEEYDEAPDATEQDADFDAVETNAKEVTY